MTPKEALRRIERFAARHGATIRRCSPQRYAILKIERSDEVSEAIFAKVAVDYNKKEVLCRADRLESAYFTMMLIHELGHILASREPPQNSREQAFLGWEVLVASKLGLRRYWEKTVLHTYVLGYDDAERLEAHTISQLNASKRREFFRLAVMTGRKYGNIGPNGTPKSVRA